jgi:transcriptional regulator with XRE-family HTH domain
MPETFGARLRQRREDQNIALVTIAEQTKIKASLLEALERDDVSHWPSGIFRRAYVRAYAQAIGLHPDVVVREFLEVHPDPAEDLTTREEIASAGDGGRSSGGPPTRLRYIVGSAFASLSRLRRSPHVDGLVTVEVASNAGRSPSTEAAPMDHDFLAVAHLCTELGRVGNADQVQPLLEEVARILDASGLIVWIWDASAGALTPALVYGYSDAVISQLPALTHDADNATAAAFRSAQTCAIDGSEHASGALVLPLLTPAGCAGVLALELQRGGEHSKSVRAIATIVAALLAQLVGGGTPAQGRQEGEVMVPAVRESA